MGAGSGRVWAGQWRSIKAAGKKGGVRCQGRGRG